jgi:hypothetical protein
MHAAGGGAGYVDFSFYVSNYGDVTSRCGVQARIGETSVECRPSGIELIPNQPQQLVRVIVPRPELGELIAEFNHETTLYGRALTVEVVSTTAEDVRAEETWMEHIYTAEENQVRHDIQQRFWRISLGQGSEADHHGEAMSAMMRRIDERDAH